MTPDIIESYNRSRFRRILVNGIMYQERTYRNIVRTDDLVQFKVIVKETDLLIRAKKDLSQEAKESVIKYRNQLETYIAINPIFEKSLIPVEEAPHVPEIIEEMIRTSSLARVGPMAAVAGAMAQSVSEDLLRFSDEVIVENGGDIYLVTSKERTVGIYAGLSPLSMKVGIMIKPKDSPIGICTSSGTVGPSLSFGKADAVCILSKSTALADAAATAVGNVVREKKDIERGLERGQEIEGVLGILIIIGEKMGVWGKIRLIRL